MDPRTFTVTVGVAPTVDTICNSPERRVPPLSAVLVLSALPVRDVQRLTPGPELPACTTAMSFSPLLTARRLRRVHEAEHRPARGVDRVGPPVGEPDEGAGVRVRQREAHLRVVHPGEVLDQRSPRRRQVHQQLRRAGGPYPLP